MTIIKHAPCPILILGGAGNFGRRLALRLLAEPGVTVLITGRRLDPLRRLAADNPALRVVDLAGGLPALLARETPFLVIDTTGQTDSDPALSVIRAAIAAHAHYLDLSADRSLPARVQALDEAARAAGVSVIVGASSVPALTLAIARDLAAGIDPVARVETAISAAASGTVGTAVLAMVLAELGRPFKSWTGAAETESHGFCDWQRLTLESPRQPVVTRRVGRWPVPDLDLIPHTLPGRPGAFFRSGVESPWQNRLVQLLAVWIRHVGWRRPQRLAPLAARVSDLFARFSSGRSGLLMTLTGQQEGRAITRHFTLLATEHRGTEIPILPAALIARALRDGRVPTGVARSADLLTLEDFRADFARLQIATHQTSIPAAGLFPTVMGAAFAHLPPRVQALHGGVFACSWSGRVTVTHGPGAGAARIRRLFGAPPAGQDLPARFDLIVEDTGERWIRDFGGARFASYLSLGPRPGTVRESFGPFRFDLAPVPAADGFALHLAGWSIGPLPLPRALAPRFTARGTDDGTAYRFDVDIHLPWVGQILRYSGHLTP